MKLLMCLNNVHPLWVGIISLLILQTGCVRERFDDCLLTTNLHIIVEITDYQPEIMPVKKAVIYLFDRNRTYIRQIEVNEKELSNRLPVPVSYSSEDIPWVVIWGNAKDRTEIPEFIPGTSMEKLVFKLISEADGHSLYPDNLFYGIKQLAGSDREEVNISPKTGRVNITVKKMPEDDKEEIYYFSAVSDYSGYAFTGAPVKGKSTIKLPAVFNSKRDLVTPGAYNLIHYPLPVNKTGNNDQALIIQLYRKSSGGEKDSLITSVEKDVDGNYLVPRPGEMINVLIYFNQCGTAEITVKITSWDEIYEWQEW